MLLLFSTSFPLEPDKDPAPDVESDESDLPELIGPACVCRRAEYPSGPQTCFLGFADGVRPCLGESVTIWYPGSHLKS